MKFRTLYIISVFNRKNNKVVYQSKPTASLKLAKQELYENGYAIMQTDINTEKSTLIAYDNCIIFVQKIKGAYTLELKLN